ncbi:MAG: hypothetical protein IPG59_10705 [Candidatus Melainabacteria bacterium]|nr:MAG: hypothetical protein IPG59_10705 [Candidatus Melainabacteria bacterium]
MTLNRKRNLLEDSCFCAIVSVTILITLVTAQAIIPNSVSIMELYAKNGCKLIGFCFFILFFPFAFKSLCERKGFKIENDTGPICFAILISTITGFFSNTDLSIIFSSIGIVLALIAFREWLGNSNSKRNCILVLILGILMGCCITSILFADKYHHVFFLQRLGFGETSTDTLYHSAILNISKNYNKLSIGIDGVPYTAYHMGSHWLFSQWCKLLGVGGLNFYLVGFGCLGIPLLLKSMLTFGEQISRIYLQQREQKTGENYFVLYRFAILILGFATFLPSPAARSVGLWRSVLTSESYATAITLLFFLLSLGIEYFGNVKSSQKERIPTINLIVKIGWIVALFGMISWCKLSVGFVAFIFLGYLMLRHVLISSLLNFRSKFLIILPVFLGAMLALVIYLSAKFPYQSQFAPFAFISTFISPHLVPVHVLLFYGWIWIFLGYVLLIANKTKFQSANVRNIEHLVLEALIILGLICTIPSAVIDLPAGDIISFMEPQYWLSICFFMALSYSCFHTLEGKQIDSMKRVLVAIAALGLINTCISSVTFVKEIMKSKQIISSKRNEYPVLQKALVFLGDLEPLPAREKRDLGVFIPQRIKGYWLSMPPISIPFVIPAISGLAAIDGLPPEGFEPSIYYGYWNFNFGRRIQDISKCDLDTFSTIAVSKGLKKIVYVESEDFKFKKIDCYDIFLKGHQKK